MDIVDELNARLRALTKLPEGRTLDEDKRIDEEIERMVSSPENQKLIERIVFTEDREEADLLRKQVIYSPDTFVSNMLQDGGRERIIRKGYSLKTVEMKYGKRWLDREYP